MTIKHVGYVGMRGERRIEFNKSELQLLSLMQRKFIEQSG